MSKVRVTLHIFRNESLNHSKNFIGGFSFAQVTKMSSFVTATGIPPALLPAWGIPTIVVVVPQLQLGGTPTKLEVGVLQP